MSPELPDLLLGDFSTSAWCKSAHFNPCCHPSSAFSGRQQQRTGIVLAWGHMCQHPGGGGLLVLSCEPWSCSQVLKLGQSRGALLAVSLCLGHPESRLFVPSCCPHVCAQRERGVRSVTSGLALFKAPCAPGPACRIRI